MNGLVSTLRPGTASISATIDGIKGSSQIAIREPSIVLSALAGNGQNGISGKAFADSLVVRAIDNLGRAASGISISWSSGSGGLSDASTITDADGKARVQWKAPTSAGSVTAKSGTSSVEFSGTGRASGACQLTMNGLSLGPTDFRISLHADKPLRIAVIYVDYPDAPATESTDALISQVITPGLKVLDEISFSRLSITPVVQPKWYRMSKTIGSYDWRTFQGHRAFLQEAFGLADPDVDFSTIDAVYVFSPPSGAQPSSPTFIGGQGGGISVDGHVIGDAVTFGKDSRSFGPTILAHETGHMLGLTDLYAFDPFDGDPYQGNQFKYVGAWSIMSNVFRPGHFLAWEKRKLGFIDDLQADCLDVPGGVEEVIQPVEVAGGIKMVIVPLGSTRALAVEVRSLTGIDAGLCKAGVLIYEVNSGVASGHGTARIHGSRVTTSGTDFNRCGPWADATFLPGSGEIDSYTDPGVISVKVLGAEPGGAFRVRVTH